MKIACLGIVKNEARYIAEWIAYQLAVGFDSVILFNHNSTDATADEIGRFADKYDVRLVDWTRTNRLYQIEAYEEGLRRYKSEFDWIAFFDTDEFLSLDDGLSLNDILPRGRNVAGLVIPWANFGSSGHQTIQHGLVVENYCYRSEPGYKRNTHVKSIVRPKRIKSCVNPHYFQPLSRRRFILGRPHPYKIVDLSGVQPAWEHPGIMAAAPIYRHAKLHHYFTKSAEDWANKVARGHTDGNSYAAEEFVGFDRNEVFDDSAARHADDVRKILSRL